MTTTTTTTTATTTAIDPYAPATASGPFLHRLNPLAKLAAPIPAMVSLVFVRDLITPTVFIGIAVILVLIGARPPRRWIEMLLLGLPAGIALVSLGMSLWVDAALVDTTAPVVRIGGWTLYSGAIEIGAATGSA